MKGPVEVWEGICYLLTRDQDGVCLLRLWEVCGLTNVDGSHVSSVGASEGILLLWGERWETSWKRPCEVTLFFCKFHNVVYFFVWTSVLYGSNLDGERRKLMVCERQRERERVE